jgi:hypothetical protein
MLIESRLGLIKLRPQRVEELSLNPRWTPKTGQ